MVVASEIGGRVAREPECSILPDQRAGKENMATDLVTYLSFDGWCEAAFKHSEKHSAAKF
jgi:hypothetical protein